MAHAVATGGGERVNDVLQWLTDGAHWSGSDGIPVRILEHLKYSMYALGIASLIGVPVGLWVGHTGRGKFLAVNLAGALRAVPSLGLLYLALMILGPRLPGQVSDFVPTIIVLVVLAVPPVLAGSYAGVEQVEAAARDAARGMGMRGREVLWQVEIPCALPLVMSGIRSAALQVVATATLAATVGLGGLGRFLIDGLSVRDYGQMAGGAILIGVLALLVDLTFATLQRVVVSPGLTGKTAGRKKAQETVQRTPLRTSGS
jgi:osmoprotectant transport system permease protein